MSANHALIFGLVLVALIFAALPLARRAVLLLTAKYLVKRRLAWVSLLAVALCVALVLIVLSVMGGWLEMFRSSFKSLTGDLIVSRESLSGFPYYEEMISEIEKLERRYQENPQGLTFATLAEAYRKSGDPERALARLAPGLELHPDYIPASIVQGRCHLDMGNEPEAEASFSHVLSLDPENVIALKALADITERGARFEEAERWLL